MTARVAWTWSPKDRLPRNAGIETAGVTVTRTEGVLPSQFRARTGREGTTARSATTRSGAGYPVRSLPPVESARPVAGFMTPMMR